MKIQAPLRHFRRMTTTCYGPKGKYNFSAALGSDHVFEVEDFVTAIHYTALDNALKSQGEFLWENGEWASLTSEVAQARLTEIEKPTDKAAIAPDLFTAAREYAAAYDKKWNVVKKAVNKLNEKHKTPKNDRR